AESKQVEQRAHHGGQCRRIRAERSTCGPPDRVLAKDRHCMSPRLRQDPSAGRPNSNGWIVEFDYLPFNRSGGRRSARGSTRSSSRSTRSTPSSTARHETTTVLAVG